MRKKITNLIVCMTFFLLVFVLSQLLLNKLSAMHSYVTFFISIVIAVLALKNFEFKVN